MIDLIEVAVVIIVIYLTVTVVARSMVGGHALGGAQAPLYTKEVLHESLLCVRRPVSSYVIYSL